MTTPMHLLAKIIHAISNYSTPEKRLYSRDTISFEYTHARKNLFERLITSSKQEKMTILIGFYLTMTIRPYGINNKRDEKCASSKFFGKRITNRHALS